MYVVWCFLLVTVDWGLGSRRSVSWSPLEKGRTQRRSSGVLTNTGQRNDIYLEWSSVHYTVETKGTIHATDWWFDRPHPISGYERDPDIRETGQSKENSWHWHPPCTNCGKSPFWVKETSDSTSSYKSVRPASDTICEGHTTVNCDVRGCWVVITCPWLQ